MMKKLRSKYYNKRITTRDNVDVRSHDKEKSKLNSTIDANSGVLVHLQIMLHTLLNIYYLQIFWYDYVIPTLTNPRQKLRNHEKL